MLTEEIIAQLARENAALQDELQTERRITASQRMKLLVARAVIAASSVEIDNLRSYMQAAMIIIDGLQRDYAAGAVGQYIYRILGDFLSLAEILENKIRQLENRIRELEVELSSARRSSETTGVMLASIGSSSAAAAGLMGADEIPAPVPRGASGSTNAEVEIERPPSRTISAPINPYLGSS